VSSGGVNKVGETAEDLSGWCSGTGGLAKEPEK